MTKKIMHTLIYQQKPWDSLSDTDCMACCERNEEKENGKCRRDNITYDLYEIQCSKCEMKYIGESARNAKNQEMNT